MVFAPSDNPVKVKVITPVPQPEDVILEPYALGIFPDASIIPPKLPTELEIS